MAEAPGSRTQPPRVGGGRPVLKTGRATGPRSLPCGTHHRMALQFPRPPAWGAAARRAVSSWGWATKTEQTTRNRRFVLERRECLGLRGDQTAMSGAVPALGGDGAGGR